MNYKALLIAFIVLPLGGPCGGNDGGGEGLSNGT
jgi:hypothetical protein